jgi:hypothetical protein
MMIIKSHRMIEIKYLCCKAHFYLSNELEINPIEVQMKKLWPKYNQCAAKF